MQFSFAMTADDIAFKFRINLILMPAIWAFYFHSRYLHMTRFLSFSKREFASASSAFLRLPATYNARLHPQQRILPLNLGKALFLALHEGHSITDMTQPHLNFASCRWTSLSFAFPSSPILTCCVPSFTSSNSSSIVDCFPASCFRISETSIILVTSHKLPYFFNKSLAPALFSNSEHGITTIFNI